MSRHQSFRKHAATALLLATLTPTAALAHPGHEISQNLMAGLLHPLTGLDHVLMIVAVGAWAALLPPMSRVAIAACLALFVGAGALLPVDGGPALEAAIALTVVGAGILLAVGRRWPLWATGAVAALFAMIHGLAHGAEGPVSSPSYVGGLMLATGALAFFAASLATSRFARPSWMRVGGLGSAAIGIVTLTG